MYDIATQKAYIHCKATPYQYILASYISVCVRCDPRVVSRKYIHSPCLCVSGYIREMIQAVSPDRRRQRRTAPQSANRYSSAPRIAQSARMTDTLLQTHRHPLFASTPSTLRSSHFGPSPRSLACLQLAPRCRPPNLTQPRRS